MREEEQPMTGEVATIKRESFQTTEREEIENLRQIYWDKWYKEQLQVRIDYNQPPKREQKNSDYSEVNEQVKDLILELDISLDLITEALWDSEDSRAYDLARSLERIDKKTLLGKLKSYGLAIKLSYE